METNENAHLEVVLGCPNFLPPCLVGGSRIRTRVAIPAAIYRSAQGPGPFLVLFE